MQVPLLPAPVSIEGPLAPLVSLAYNLAWAWRPEVRALFARIDPDAPAPWNPVALLRRADRIAALSEDPEFAARCASLAAKLQKEVRQTSISEPVAYFCIEHGLTACLPFYAGGLGILAGDHLKAASDAALPLIGVGLVYRAGYFRQSIDADGRQHHGYPSLRIADLPLRQVRGAAGGELTVSVPIGDRSVRCLVLCAQVGRVPLLLLDTALEENHPEDRAITRELYVGDRETRLRQEIVLGVGGERALRALGISPRVYHLNEGHSAFVLIERARQAMFEGASLAEAFARVRARTVFTIHTPVPAGNERFEPSLLRRLAGPALAASCVDLEAVLAAGAGADGHPGAFDMTAFCLRSARASNGVSQLHGRTATETWAALVPKGIAAVTNGVHVPTWLGAPIARLLDAHGLTASARREAGLAGGAAEMMRARLAEAPAGALWAAHLEQKGRLLSELKRRMHDEASRRGQGDPPEVDGDALILGFARRFAAYKRATLILGDPERLARLTADGRSIAIVFAGKAHPSDTGAQGILREVYQASLAHPGRIVLLEEYDHDLAHVLVQGVDLWLNNPVRPLEASGTSGMKAAMNGIPNLSILDGWWDEGYDGGNGWAIGGRDPFDLAQDKPATDGAAERDARDRGLLYAALEDEVVPAYFDRGPDGIPLRWVERMRGAIASSVWRFSAARMIEDYRRIYDG